MKNDLGSLPWAQGQYYMVENYWEAAGVMAALRTGIDPDSVRRPLWPANVDEYESDSAIITGALASQFSNF